MCCNASAMKSVRLFLTTQPSNVKSMMGRLSEATGPRSLFRTVAVKFRTRNPKN